MIGADGLVAANNELANAELTDEPTAGTAPSPQANERPVILFVVEAHEWLVKGSTTRITYTTAELEFRHGGIVLTRFTWARPAGQSGASDDSVFLPYDRINSVLMGGVE